MNWFRVYHDIIDDPKILQLSAEMRWYYVGILAVSSRQSQQNMRGILPKLEDVSVHLRLNKPKTLRVVRTLIQAGLIDQEFNGSPGNIRLSVHGWNERQFKSDDITERVRKYRGNVSGNVSVTGRTRVRARSETETETETEGGREKCPPLFNSRQQEVIDLATARWGASNGDSIVGDLLRVYSPELVMEAIDRHFAKVGASIKPALLMATCRGMLADGWTPEAGNSKPLTVVKTGAKTYGIIPGP